MSVQVLFDGEPHVHYAQISDDSRDGAGPQLGEAFAGQASPLCGAAVPCALLR